VKTGQRKTKVPSKVIYLKDRVERARRIAANSIHPIVAEIWEEHARLCELNSERERKQGKSSGPRHAP
jgi:hypothetical protein